MLTHRVLLVDDHEVVHRGIQETLEYSDRYTVVGAASDAREALNAVYEHQPDIVILDISLGEGPSGLQVLEDLQGYNKDMKFIVMTMNHDADTFQRAFYDLGAKGYILKSDAMSNLEAALDMVVRGKTYTSPTLGGFVAAALGQGSFISNLTNRQREVFLLLGQAKTSREIGEFLDLSADTIHSHIREMKNKLNINNRNELVLMAVNYLNSMN